MNALDLTLARAIYLRQANYPGNLDASLAYQKANRIDSGSMLPQLSCWGVAQVCDTGKRRFDFIECDETFSAFVIEPLGADGETPVPDLIAWPLNKPEKVFTFTGECPVLGHSNAFNPASYYRGNPCHIWRTPLAWLQSGCKGICIIDVKKATPLLIEMACMGWLAAEDLRHARDIIRIAGDAIAPRLVVPSNHERRAAA